MRFGKMFAWQFAMSVFVVLTNKAMAISSDDHHLDHARSCYPVLDEAKFGGSSRFTSRKSEVRPTSKSESAHLHPNETLENVDSLDKLPTLEGSRVLSVSPLERASLTDYHTFVHVSKDVIDAKHFKTAALSEIQPASSLSKFEPRMLSPIQINSRDGTSVHEVLQTSSGDKSLLLFVSKPGIQNGRINFMPLIMNKEATSSELSSYPLKWPRHLVQPLPNDPSAVNYFAISQNTVAYFNRSTHTFQIWNIHNGESLLSQVESFLQNTVLEFYDDIRSLHFRALALSPSGRRAVLISKQYAFIFDFQTGRVDFVHSKSEFKIPPSTDLRTHDYFDDAEKYLALETVSEIYLIDLLQLGKMMKLPKKEVHGFYASSGILQFAQASKALVYMNDVASWQAFDVKTGKSLKFDPKK